MGDSAEKKIEPRRIEDLYRAFTNADHIVRKRYRDELDQYPVRELPEWLLKKIPEQENSNADPVTEVSDDFGIKLGDNTQFFRVEKLVYDRKENIVDKLTTVYRTMASFRDTSVIMLIISDGMEMELYLGIAERGLNNGNYSKSRGDKLDALQVAFESNFIGSKVNRYINKSNSDTKNDNNNKPDPISSSKLIDTVFSDATAVACVTGVASVRDYEQRKNEEFVQGMEKLIEAMRGKKFSALFMADCKGISEIESLCADYEDIASQLSPFAQTQQTVGRTEGITDTESLIKGVTDTTNDSISNTISHSDTFGGSAGYKFISANYSHTKSQSDTKTSGVAKSLTEQNSTAKALSSSSNEGIQITFQNRAIKTLTERIDEQIKHLRTCEAYGVFDFGCYFVAPEAATATAAASIYDALMRGEESSAELSSVNTWTNDGEIRAAQEVIQYLKRFYHPLVLVPDYSKAEEDGENQKVNMLSITPTTIVSGKELALHMGLPKKSVSGIPVVSCAEFGRAAVSTDGSKSSGVHLGNVFHMQREEKTAIELDADSLTMHTFITGSTGSGKSNTVFRMLLNLMDKPVKGDKDDSSPQNEQIKILVIEPAKGEYRKMLSNKNVSVYGTNPLRDTLLRINPFSFPEKIHVFEHMDRVIEIFNACWPMYAAMPAVLKDAVERAYVDAGWDLQDSTNRYGKRIFPCFTDVLRNIDIVMNESQYSADSKSDYKGALSTRLRSLTNGLNGLIFGCDELSDEEIFDKNVVVDISRVGSPETKSLLMGFLIMKLQEYRMAGEKMNAHLRHVTVLEEAHNLLKRTSTEQGAESANLAGKSVEMLTNAIAEMRTYGEGFVIVDQSPSLLDMAVIRNTNTKIILRLPEYSDRELVGRSASLNDEQITELARLKKGVAAVYQNDWIGPVLCQVDYEKPNNLGEPADTGNKEPKKNHGINIKGKLVGNILSGQFKDIMAGIDPVDESIIKGDLPASLKCRLLEYVSRKDKSANDIDDVAAITYDLLDGAQLFKTETTGLNLDVWQRQLRRRLDDELAPLPDEYQQIILNLLVYWYAHETESVEARMLLENSVNVGLNEIRSQGRFLP